MADAEKPVLSSYRDRMDKAISALKDEFASLRTGRASAGLLDQVMVEAYGSTVPLNQVAAVSVPEPRSITVSVWDKGMVVSVEKAIRSSGSRLARSSASSRYISALSSASRRTLAALSRNSSGDRRWCKSMEPFMIALLGLKPISDAGTERRDLVHISSRAE